MKLAFEPFLMFYSSWLIEENLDMAVISPPHVVEPFHPLLAGEVMPTLARALRKEHRVGQQVLPQN